MLSTLKRVTVLGLLLMILTLPCVSLGEEPSRAAQANLPQVNSPVIELMPEWAPVPFLEKENTLAVYTIPVGAQDAYLIVCDGHAMVLDCAALGQRPVEDYLLRLLVALGIDRLDYAVNTHPHKDHMMGFAELLSHVPADVFYTCFPRNHNGPQRNLMRDLARLGIPVVDYEPGTPFTLGGAQITTWQMRAVNNDNDRSLILRLQYGERSILFTADIQLTTQRIFAETCGTGLESDIMKLPHHGIGDLSGKLVRAVKPGLCWASNSVKYKGCKLQVKTCQLNEVPLIFTAYVPMVMVTDGTTWQVQVWHEDSIELPHFRMITDREDEQIGLEQAV